MSLRSAPNHKSLITTHAGVPLFTLSPSLAPSHISLITSHVSRPRKRPRGVHLRLFAVTPAFGASPDKALRSRPRPRIRPRGVWSVAPSWNCTCVADWGLLKKIFSSGFEIVRIRVSQWGVTAGFSEFMIKKWQSGDQIQDHNRGGDKPSADPYARLLETVSRCRPTSLGDRNPKNRTLLTRNSETFLYW